MTSSLRVIERPKLSMSKISTICIPPSTHQSQQHSSAGDMEEIHALPQSRPGKMPCIPRAVVTPHENQLEHTIAPPPPPRWSWRIGGSYSCSTMPSLMVHIAMLCILPWTVWKISVLPWVTSKVLKRSLGKRLGSLVFVFLTMWYLVPRVVWEACLEGVVDVIKAGSGLELVLVLPLMAIFSRLRG